MTKKFGGGFGKACTKNLASPLNLNMNHLNKLTGFIRYPSGIEWGLFKKLPLILGIGTAVPIGIMSYICLSNSALNPSQQKIIYQCLGILFTYWFFVGTAAIGCVLVILMKGPAYVSDPYELPEENKLYEKN